MSACWEIRRAERSRCASTSPVTAAAGETSRPGHPQRPASSTGSSAPASSCKRIRAGRRPPMTGRRSLMTRPIPPHRSRDRRSWLAAPSVDNAEHEQRPDVLTYTSAALAEPLEIAGTVVARIDVTADNGHHDLFARLCDVDEQGRSWNVCDRMTRLTPDRPAVTPGDPAGRRTVCLELWPCAHRFAAGHRLRLQVSGGRSSSLCAQPRHRRAARQRHSNASRNDHSAPSGQPVEPSRHGPRLISLNGDRPNSVPRRVSGILRLARG